MEGIDCRPERDINKALVFQLSTCGHIKARQDVLTLGKRGVGKSHLAQALGNPACRGRIATRHVALDELFGNLAVAAGGGTLSAVLGPCIRPSLLMLDDYLLARPSIQGSERPLRLVEERMHIGSATYCSRLQPDGWRVRIDGGITADAVPGRVVNRSQLIELEGEAMRKGVGP
ncbi:MAG: ATP-binding protein [Actinomycetia bacterium]|nr:ATP-binding protein [Actinomycetes bacterium]